MKYYVVLAEWCVEHEGGHQIVGIYTSRSDAIEAFRNRVDNDDRLLAIEYGYIIEEDSETYFESYEDGYYSSNHICVGIEEVEQ